ncbi:MAG: CotH kinase family protein [Planctomycetota bacterium]
MRTTRPARRCSALVEAALIVMLSAPWLAAQSAVLTEFMASNSNTLPDEDGDYSDWIEVYNQTASPLNLGGWFLTDDDDDLTRWALPDPTWVESHAFLIVFASGKDRAVSGQELHTDFKLSADGEYLALVYPDGVTVATEYAPEYPEQYTDASFGLAFENGNVTDRRTYFVQPTPGAENPVGGPLILDVAHTPQKPGTQDDIVVTAFVPDDLGPSGSVELIWRVMYNSPFTSAMRDDGLGGDTVAGDKIYAGSIDSLYTAPGLMVRYQVKATDSSSRSTTVPLFLDPLGAPEYFGTMISDPSLVTELPVWHWFVEYPHLANRAEGTRASVYYLDQFYDNVKVRPRGQTSTSWPKLHYKFDFNPSDRLLFQEGGVRVDEANINSTYSDKAFIRQPLAWNLYRDAGAGYSISFPLRVQQNGQFFSVAIFVEQPDEDYLERNGLDPDGALYKMFNPASTWRSGYEKKTRLWEDNSDLRALVEGLKLSDWALTTFVYDNIDIAACINYLGATCLMHDNDHVAKNYYLYRDTEGDCEWQFLPWDKDLTFGRNFTLEGGVLNDTMWADHDPQSHPLFGDRYHLKIDNYYNRLIDALYKQPLIVEMYLCRLRTLMNRFLQPPGFHPVSMRYFEGQIAEYVHLVEPDVALDRERWGIPGYGYPYDFHESIERLKALYLEVRRIHLFWTHGSPSGIIPPEARCPEPLYMSHIEGDPASGIQDDEYIEISNPNDLPIDMSAWTLSGGISFTFPPGTVINGHGLLYVSPNLLAFRSRSSGPSGGQGLFVVGPYDGHISSGEMIRLADDDGKVNDEQTY